jgi:uncharacterized protein YndB with AHSA1/START domain
MNEEESIAQSGEPAAPTSDSAVIRATGQGHEAWFALLDGWGATDRAHPEIAAWLGAEHGVSGWWSQSITVAYERARGLRAQHEMRDGFQVGATRTIAADATVVLAAFTDEAIRGAWLPDAPMSPRPTRAAGTARFDWSDPPSRVVVHVTPKGEGRTSLSISHERLPDAEVAEELKARWREHLGVLKEMLDG